VSEYHIFRNIQKHISLSDLEKQQFGALLSIKDVPRKDLVLRQGQIPKSLFFVEFGSLRAFNVDDAGKESTIMFAVQDWWITDMNSFANQKPAMVSIEALENCRIVELGFQSLENLYQKIPKFERYFRILFQNAYIREQLRALNSISLTTEERYTQFVEKYPAIAERITQKQIASYLGVTPEFLSSIKKK
jgi:CRP-like cAMP-binding protein